ADDDRSGWRRFYRCVWLYCLWRCVFFFFFSSRRRHTRFSRDWSSDVCSSDLVEIFPRWMAGVIAVTIALGGGAHLASGTAATGDRGGTRPATLDSLIHRVEALRNPAARHEAVKTLGSRRDPRMVPPLLAIAQQDGDEEVQHEAVKALGKVRGGGGVGALLEIARTHPDPGVRRKAVKMVGEVATAEAALGVLERLAQRDPDVEVQQEAVEALG